MALDEKTRYGLATISVRETRSQKRRRLIEGVHCAKRNLLNFLVWPAKNSPYSNTDSGVFQFLNLIAFAMFVVHDVSNLQ